MKSRGSGVLALHHRRVVTGLASLAACAGLLLAGCQADTGGRALLRPSLGPVTLSDYRPDRPFEPKASNLLARTLFSERTPSGVRIEVHELLVGPKLTTASTSLTGAAVFDIRAGSGAITRSGKAQGIKAGATLALGEGEVFAITNSGDTPLVVAAYSFAGQ